MIKKLTWCIRKLLFNKEVIMEESRNKNDIDIQKITSKIGTVNSTLSVIILDIKGINASVKGKTLTEWIKKHDPRIYCLQVTHFRFRETYQLKGRKNMHHVNNNHYRTLVVMLTSDKQTIRQKLLRKTKNDIL